jgi:hypothetical protein
MSAGSPSFVLSRELPQPIVTRIAWMANDIGWDVNKLFNLSVF